MCVYLRFLCMKCSQWQRAPRVLRQFKLSAGGNVQTVRHKHPPPHTHAVLCTLTEQHYSYYSSISLTSHTNVRIPIGIVCVCVCRFFLLCSLSPYLVRIGGADFIATFFFFILVACRCRFFFSGLARAHCMCSLLCRHRRIPMEYAAATATVLDAFPSVSDTYTRHATHTPRIRIVCCCLLLLPFLVSKLNAVHPTPNVHFENVAMFVFPSVRA